MGKSQSNIQDWAEGWKEHNFDFGIVQYWFTLIAFLLAMGHCNPGDHSSVWEIQISYGMLAYTASAWAEAVSADENKRIPLIKHSGDSFKN